MAWMVCTRLCTKNTCPPRSSSRRIACRTSRGRIRSDVRDDRQAFLGRRIDGRDVAHAGQRHVQRARDGRGGQGQHIHLGAHLLERLLVRHPEALLLIDDQQSQVFEPAHPLKAGGACR